MGSMALGPEGLVNVDGDVVVYLDGKLFAGNVDPDQLVREIKGPGRRLSLHHIDGSIHTG